MVGKQVVCFKMQAGRVIDIPSNVGIGTTNPLHSLHTKENIMAGSDGTVRGVFSAGNDGSGNYLYAGMKGGDSTNAVKFGVYLNSGLAEQGYIAISNQNGGRVGVNTTSPTAQFHVNNTTDTTSARFSTSNTLNYIHLTNAGGANHYIQTNQHGLALSADENNTRGSIQLKTSNTNRLSITSDGKVGIGTSSPNQIFNVRDSANSLDLFSVRSTGSETRIGIGKSSADCAIDFSTSLPNGGGTIQNIFRNNFINNVRTGSHNGRLVLQSNNGIRIAGYGDNPSGNVYGLEVKNTRDGTADAVLNVMKYDDTNIFMVESQGYIGVNENDPQASLHINKVGSNSPILFYDGYYGYGLGSGNMPSDVDPNSNNFRMYMSSTRLHMVTSHGSGQFRWLNGGSNRRMTLDHNGNLVLGLNVDPSQKLDIQGNSSSGTIIQIRDTGDDYPVGITYNHGVSGHHYAWYAGTMDGTSGERSFTIGVKVSDGFHNDLTTDSYSLLRLNQWDNSANFAGSILANPDADSTHVFGR